MWTDRQTKQLDALQNIVSMARLAFHTEHLIIAGGAPRDILSCVPVKDIDVFIDLDSAPDSPMTDKDEASAWFMAKSRYLAALLYYPNAELKFNEDNEYGVDVCDIVYGTGAPIQIVGLHGKNPIDDVHCYDFGLSQSFVCPTGVFHTQAAMLDRSKMTITYMDNAPDHASFLRSVKRFHRLREKYYGGWRFINCEKLENYDEDDFRTEPE